MISLHTLTLLVLCSAVTVSLLPRVGSAQEGYEREERRSSTRMSEQDLRSFESFLDSHDDTAQELYRDPELVNNDRFLRGHSALRDWFDDHREAAAALRDNPRVIIWRERTASGRAREELRSMTARISEQDLRSFEDYLDSHSDTAQALYQNPDLSNDRRFVRDVIP